MRKPTGQSIYVLAIVAVCVSAVAYVAWDRSLEAQPGRSVLRLDRIPFDGATAYRYLQQICQFGPRPSGSPAMQKQQQWLTEHFQRLGGTVERQEFVVRHPRDGSAVRLANLIVHWHADRPERILLCAHYDTRPFPDRDPRNPGGTFLGANDGASGAALLMELGRHMPELAGTLGVDFVLFDGEELIFRDPPDEYFLGSKYFARQYVATPPAHRYRAGVLLDMVADVNLQLFVEKKSMQFAPTVVNEIWSTAQRLGVTDFIYLSRFDVNDDHIPLNEIAKIPTADLIDFDYPHWHTEQDRPNHCSALSLAKVGWVVLEWLRTAVK